MVARMPRLPALLAALALAFAPITSSCSSPDEPTAAKPRAVAAPPTTTTTIGMLIAWIEEEEPPTGLPPLVVQFQSTVKGGVPPYRYTWDFDDESEPSHEANPTHTYTEPGRYWPELVVTDARGETDDDTTIAEVLEPDEE
jgi:PKD repeat protein